MSRQNKAISRLAQNMTSLQLVLLKSVLIIEGLVTVMLDITLATTVVDRSKHSWFV